MRDPTRLPGSDTCVEAAPTCPAHHPLSFYRRPAAPAAHAGNPSKRPTPNTTHLDPLAPAVQMWFKCDVDPRPAVDERRRQAALYALGLLDTEPEEEFDRIARLAQRLLSTRSALVSFMDHDRQWYKAKVGVETTEAERSATFCTHVVDDGAPLVVDDATRDPRFADNPHVVEAGGVRLYAGVPIHSPGGHAVGTLCVFDSTPRTLRDGDLMPLLDLAAVVDEIIAARVNATLDDLTGVQNRGGFLRAAAPLLRLADRADTTMTLGFFDVDGLKQINDSLGHEAGDRAIATVGRVLTETFRAADVIGRLGGDEFAVLYAVTDEEGANTAFTRFQAALRDASRDLPFTLTVAAGFITRPPRGATIEQLLTEADQAMYRRKRATGDTTTQREPATAD